MTSPRHDPTQFEDRGDVLDDVFRRLLLVGAVILAIAVAVIVIAWLLARH